ncbi:MAG: radical SAM family heme chaperone HemW [Actinobacteria bacterium]|nr:radical SAM family heme chaperone HemW [Actinomycetota bacterium]
MGEAGPTQAVPRKAASSEAAPGKADSRAADPTGAGRAGARHLYLHLPFCAHRCGYCDFVTAVGKHTEHAGYVDALLAEFALEQHLLADEVGTIFVGGGTPTFTEPAALARLLAALPAAGEFSVEANPETVTSRLAALLREHGVNRVSIGAQSFQPHLLEALERRATPADVRAAVPTLRAAGFDNLSLDLIYGIPGQTEDDLARDLDAALALEPEHLSCYELEAKPGTRFTHAYGDELARQADAMESYFEAVVETLTAAGYRWYETANFCRADSRRDFRSHHNLGYWRGRDYLGIGVGAVSTIECLRWRNVPSVRRYVATLAHGKRPSRELEPLDADVQARERVLLGLRLDQPLATAGLGGALDPVAVERLERLGLARSLDGGALLELTPRGRFLGGGVTAELLA